MSKIEDGGSAFPDPARSRSSLMDKGISVRDYFAMKVTTDEIRDFSSKFLSNSAKEKITGLKAPIGKSDCKTSEQIVSFQLLEIEFECAVNAAVRFMMADALLKARKR